MRRLLRLSLAALAVALLPSGLFAQDGGTITGRVIDLTTNQPLSDVQVVLAGTTRGALTNAQGVYRIADVEPGTYSVRASRIGFEGEAVQVTVATGETVTADLTLQPAAVSLDAVVVTATGEQKKRELANAVSNVNADEIVREAPVSSLSELMTGRAAGVNVLQSSGTTGTSSRIRIRGSTSISLSNEPIIFIDGIRVESSAESTDLTGGQVTSVMNSINPEEIESIEIIKGPSAATLYGTDAANGVIRITTKRGVAGAPRWNVWVEQGLLEDRNDYPLNYAGFTAGGDGCFAFQEAMGACTVDDLQGFQPLEDDRFSPLSTGYRQQYGASVAGGADVATYFLSGEYESERGVFELPDFYMDQLVESGTEVPDYREHPNTMERVSLRANVGSEIAEGLRANVSTGYITSDTWLPQNDNNGWGMIPSGILGWHTPEINEGYGFLPPDEVFAIEVANGVERFTGSTNLNWQPSSWFTGRATFGVDNISQELIQFFPVGQVSDPGVVNGARWVNSDRILNYTADVGGTAEFSLTDAITSRTSVGVQYYRDYVKSLTGSSELLGPGTDNVGAGAIQQADESTAESVTLGTFVEQQFGWNDRLYVTAALRSDDHSAFGQDFDVIIYPKFGASYVVVDQGDEFYGMDWLNSLRLRMAWGQSGRAPGATDALTYFDPVISTLDGSDAPAVIFGNLGNSELKPERSEEIELGFDAGFLDGRAGLEVTYYDKTTEDVLVSRVLPPSLGLTNEVFDNLGEVENQGWEIAANATPVASNTLVWDVNATYSSNKNELIELGEGIPPIIFGDQRITEGAPLGGFWAAPITFDDANGDGLIGPAEVSYGEEAEFIGSAFPETEFSLQSGVTFFDRVRVSGMLDYRGDFYQFNNTERFRCQFAICEGLNNPDAPLFEQARALDAAVLNDEHTLFIEDASFWKLRELSVNFIVPEGWAAKFGASRANLVLSGRNLATWTDYTGLDPELNSVPTANFSSQDFLTQPPVTTWVLRLNLGF